MVVGMLSVNMIIPGSNSLKDKRHVVKSMLDHIRNKFNVSAAEIGELDIWRAEIGWRVSATINVS